MTSSFFTTVAAGGPWVGALLGLMVGSLLGLAHFGSLWRITRAFTTGGLILPLVLQIGRFALLVGVFWMLARIGAAALLAGALGLTAARALVLRRVGRSS